GTLDRGDHAVRPLFSGHALRRSTGFRDEGPGLLMGFGWSGFGQVAEGSLQEPAGPVMGGEQRLDSLPKRGVVLTSSVQVGSPRDRVSPFERLGEDGHQVGIVVGHRFTSESGFLTQCPVWTGTAPT